MRLAQGQSQGGFPRKFETHAAPLAKVSQHHFTLISHLVQFLDCIACLYSSSTVLGVCNHNTGFAFADNIPGPPRVRRTDDYVRNDEYS